MNAQEFIAAKRDGIKHTQQELVWFANAVAKNELPDYQVSAWLMAAYLHPLDQEETAWLTMAMASSGDRIDRSGLPHPWIDKHSTGGVGDKTTLVLLPLLAACGLSVIKMSGRGLGITGGTVDKLVSVPGFRMDLSIAELKAQALRIGLAITGQTPNLAPADKALYALRDATSTVASVPLLVSSILSKKIAGGAETLVLDVKAGSGGFMQTTAEARTLAGALAEVAELAQLKTRIAITDMSQPLGRTVGNLLEVEEAAKVLCGNEHSRFTDLCIDLAAVTFATAGISPNLEEGLAKAAQALRSGSALQKAEQWFEAQGADPVVLSRGDKLARAPVQREVRADLEGWIAGVHAGTVGQVVLDLGGGRHTKDDIIDPTVGVEVHSIVGQKVSKGEPVFTVHARDEASCATAIEALKGSVRIQDRLVEFIDPMIEIV